MPVYIVHHNWSRRGKRPTVSYEVCLRNPRGGCGPAVLRTPLRVGLTAHDEDRALAQRIADFLSDSPTNGPLN